MDRAVALNTKYIKKHHAAIHCSTELTLLQRKLANCLLFNAYHDLLNKDFHEISIPQLMSLLEIRTKDYQKLKEAIRKLLSTMVEWNVLKNVTPVSSMQSSAIETNESLPHQEVWTASTLLSSVQIDGSMIRYEYSKMLKELFYMPTGYARIKLSIQNKFKSSYALILYENCLRYINVGSTGWICLKSFRKIMGVGRDQYSLFRDLNRRVIKSSVTEINKLSDIKVDWELKKIRRNPSEIRFLVKKAPNFVKIESLETLKTNQIEDEKTPEHDDLTRTLNELGVSKKIASDWINKYDSNFIKEKIRLVNSASGEIRNIGGFLKSALENDYPIMTSQQTLKLQKSQASKEEEKIKRKQEELGEEYKEYVNQTFRQWIEGLDECGKVQLKLDLKEYLENDGRLNPLSKKARLQIDNDDNFENLTVYQMLRLFIKKVKDDGLKSIYWIPPVVIAFEEFIAKKE